MEGIYTFADEVGVLGGEFGSVIAGNDTDERRVTLDVVAPMILALYFYPCIIAVPYQGTLNIKLRFGAGQLDMSHHMGLRLLVQEPVVAVTLYVFQLCLEGISIYMLWFQPTMLEPWEHDIIAILNLLDFHIVYCLVNRSVSFTRITLPPLPTIFLRNRFFDKRSACRLVGGLHEPLLMHYWVQR